MLSSNNSGHGILELCKTYSLRNSRNNRHSCPVKADEAAAKDCQDLRLLNSLSGLQVTLILFPMLNCVEGSMHWKSCASKSALPSSSPGWKKNKIHAVLEVS